MDEELQALLAQLAPLREAGKSLSTANRALVAQIRAKARDKAMSHHPLAHEIDDLCEQLLALDDNVREVIRKEGAKWVLYSKDGSKKLGEFDSEDEAKQREGEINVFKHKKEASQDEDLNEANLSFEAVRDRVRAALEARYTKPGPNGGLERPYFYEVTTFPDKVVFREERNGKFWRCSYSLNEKGDVELGEVEEVIVSFEPVATAPVSESVRGAAFIEAVKGSKGTEWDVILIQAGLSKNNNYYPPEVLKKALPLFEGAAAFADHATQAERQTRPERSIKDKVGKFSNPTFAKFTVAGKVLEGVRARFKVVAPWLREVLLEASNLGEGDFLGFSIDAGGRVSRRTHEGKIVNWVDEILAVNSVDVVTDPAAGGRLVRLVASNRQEPQEDKGMDPEEIKRLIQEAIKAGNTEVLSALNTQLQEAVEAQKRLEQELVELRESQRIQADHARVDVAINVTTLSEVGRTRARKELYALVERQKDVTDEVIQAHIKEALDYEASLVGTPAPGGTRRIAVGATSHDKMRLALIGMFDGEDAKDADGASVPRFRSIKEGYCRWTGQDALEVTNWDMAVDTGRVVYDSAHDNKRIMEALATTTWADIFADVFYLKLIKEYRAAPYDAWRLIVSDIEDVPDFQTRHWARVGGYGNLSSVGQLGTYPELTTPGDEEIEYAVSKYGGIDYLSWESIVNDRVAVVRRIPGAMARAAKRTLYNTVMNLVTVSAPSMDYDTTAMYDATHANTSTNALTLGGVDTTIVAMRDQTAYGESAEILGERNKPRYVIVPNELSARAKRIFKGGQYLVQSLLDTTSGASDTGLGIAGDAFHDAGVDIIVYDALTNAKDWWAVANPAEVPTVVVGFLNGRQEPELFVQDDRNQGSTFTADKIGYKIRHVFGADVLDHRSFYYNDVA